ncbi:MAG: serine hydrolase [Pseudomonadota bacterium]
MPVALRALLSIDALRLPSYRWDETDHWDETDAPPAGLPRRAHQWLDGRDTFGFNGSVDACGGGGVVASISDLAEFLRALFAGGVFDDPETLELMMSAPGHLPDSPYRLGLFARNFEGHAMFSHGGFWGTDAYVIPRLGLVVAAVALEQNGVQALRALTRTLMAEHVARASATPPPQ